MKLALFALFVMSLTATSPGATVAVRSDLDNAWDTPAGPTLTAANVVAAIANGAAIADRGSYVLGALGIATGIAALALSGSYDERAGIVDVAGAMSVCAGTLSLLRRGTRPNERPLSLAPGMGRSGVSVSLMVRF